jgi:hypothetical protein
MLFKCVTLEVVGPDSFIPMDSQRAVVLATKFVNLEQKSQGTPADEIAKVRADALAALQDEQNSRQAAAALAAANEVQPAFHLNINNRDSLIAADVIDDLFDIFGPVGLDKAFDLITDAITLGNFKSESWEASEGYADINVGKGGVITFPRDIYRAIAIRAGRGNALLPRNRWFEFHLNRNWGGCYDDFWLGWGGDNWQFWEDRSKTVTVNEPSVPYRLVAINDLDDDDGAWVTVYGFDDQNKWIRTPNPDINDDNDPPYIDGYKFQALYSSTLPDPLSPVFSRITRITRGHTNGYQQLLAYTVDGAQEPILIGYYFPDETEPNYSRITLPCLRQSNNPNACVSWIRTRYKKRGLKVSCLTDNLNLSSRLAVVNLLRSLKAQKGTGGQPGDPTAAANFEKLAVQYLTESESSGNPNNQMVIEVEESWAHPWQGQF